MASVRALWSKHAFMPINVKVVSNKEFEEWIEFAKSGVCIFRD